MHSCSSKKNIPLKNLWKLLNATIDKGGIH
jgi:hypothetical protein